jgi:hypothetical protein
MISIFAVFMIAFKTVETVKEVKTGKDENSTAHQIANYMLDNGYDTIYSIFGLGKSLRGAEDVVVASGDKICLVPYYQISGIDATTPMKPVEHLCVKDGYKIRDNAKSLYLLREDELPKTKELAEEYGVEMTLKAQFGDMYLYSMSENLCALVGSSYEQ